MANGPHLNFAGRPHLADDPHPGVTPDIQQYVYSL